jgi:hypothetical protein
MKTLIQNTGGYQLYAEIKAVDAVFPVQHQLEFTTVYEHSKNSQESRTKAQFFLDEPALEKFKKMINNY